MGLGVDDSAFFRFLSLDDEEVTGSGLATRDIFEADNELAMGFGLGCKSCAVGLINSGGCMG